MYVPTPEACVGSRGGSRVVAPKPTAKEATMQYLLTLTYRDGEGPQEGTPEFDDEMKVWGAINDELGGRPDARRERPQARDGDDRPQRRLSSPTARTPRPRRSCSPSTSSTSRTSTRRSRSRARMPASRVRLGDDHRDGGLRAGVSARLARAGVPRRARRGPGDDHAPPGRRPRTRRGRRPGRVRGRGGRVGPPRRAGTARRVADDDRVAQGARPPAPRAGRRRVRPSAGA